MGCRWFAHCVNGLPSLIPVVREWDVGAFAHCVNGLPSWSPVLSRGQNQMGPMRVAHMSAHYGPNWAHMHLFIGRVLSEQKHLTMLCKIPVGLRQISTTGITYTCTQVRATSTMLMLR